MSTRKATVDRLTTMLRSNDLVAVDGGLVFQMFGDADKEVTLGVAYDSADPREYVLVIDYGHISGTAIQAEELYQVTNEASIQEATMTVFNELKSGLEETDNISDDLLWEQAFEQVVAPYESFALKMTNIDAAELLEEYVPDEVDIDTTMLPADIVRD